MRLIKTCVSCPEQYDVYEGDQKVAYLRLRWGYFYASMKGPLGKGVYGVEIGGSLTGQFESEEQRQYHLNLAMEAIKKELDNV